MKKLLLCLLALCLFCLPVLAEDAADETVVSLQPDGYQFANYVPGGINFLLPKDFFSFPLSDEEKAAGYVLFGCNEHFSMSMRCYAPEEYTLAEYTQMLENDAGTQVIRQENNGTPVVIYRNLQPHPQLQLYGACIEGIDGQLYKISIFTGDHNDISDEAPVWEIAGIITDSLCIVDFSSLSQPQTAQ